MWKRKIRKNTAILRDGDLLWVGQITDDENDVSNAEYRCFDLGSEDSSTSMQEWFGSPGTDLSNCHLLIPGSECFSYIVQLPTSDPTEIDQIVPFEMKRLLPFETTNLIQGYQILNIDSKDRAQVLLVGVPEDVVEACLERLAPYKARFTEISASFLCLYSYHKGGDAEGDFDPGSCSMVLEVIE